MFPTTIEATSVALWQTRDVLDVLAGWEGRSLLRLGLEKKDITPAERDQRRESIEATGQLLRPHISYFSGQVLQLEDHLADLCELAGERPEDWGW